MSKFKLSLTSLILVLLVSVLSCSNQVNYSSTDKPDMIPLVESFVREEQARDPDNLMTGDNGKLWLFALVKKYEAGKYSLCLVIDNHSTSTFPVDPSYFSLIDENGAVYKYAQSSYSIWGENTFSQAELPNGDTGVKYLDFIISPDISLKTLVYSDGISPPITVDWKYNPV